MLATETTAARGGPPRIATGRAARTYRAARLSTGTCGFSSQTPALTAATAAALARIPTNNPARVLTRETVRLLRGLPRAVRARLENDRLARRVSEDPGHVSCGEATAPPVRRRR